jgi:hypothetical protein
MAVVIDNNVLAAKINVRVCEIERAACVTLLPVARLRALAVWTTLNFEARSLLAVPIEPPASGRRTS